MPANGYDGPVTLAAGVNRLVTKLQDAGFTGRFGFTGAKIINKTGAAIYFARRSDVSDAGATKGHAIANNGEHVFPAPGGRGTIDLNKLYIYSAGGGDIEFSGSTR